MKVKDIVVVDWEAISSLHFVFEDNCWESCQANCCQSEIPQAEFKFIKNPGTYVFYLPQEYAYKKNTTAGGRICSQSESRSREISLILASGVKLGGIWHYCPCEGLCSESMKPLADKLYPFLPIMDIDGNVIDVSLINVFDVTIEAMGFEKRCSIISRLEKYKQLWMHEPTCLAPLNHPYILFYLMAGNLFYDNFRESLLNDARLTGKIGTDFWSAWEIEYLLGRLCDKNKLISAISNLYTKFQKRYEGFRL